MFFSERNFIVVFLVIFFKIDQGIYCPEHGTILQITYPMDFDKKISQDEYSIIFFTSKSQDQNNSCNRTKSILEELIREKITQGVIIYELDIQKFPYYAKYTWRVLTSPILISLRNGVQFERLGSQYTDNKTKVTKMINTLTGKYVEDVEEPEYYEYFYKINNLQQLALFATKNDYIILDFCFPSWASCVVVFKIIKELKEKPEYKKINIYFINITNVAAASHLFNILWVPTLSAYRMDKKVDQIFAFEAMKKNLVENMFKKLIENDKQADDASAETKTEDASDNTSNIVAVTEKGKSEEKVII